jgi:hypothetical protein
VLDLLAQDQSDSRNDSKVFFAFPWTRNCSRGIHRARLRHQRPACLFDVIIKGGTVYDGTGGEPKPADVLQPSQREKHLKAFTRIEFQVRAKELRYCVLKLSTLLVTPSPFPLASIESTL